MNDKEMLELAAKAAGLTDMAMHDKDMQKYLSRWNPLDNDADALRLAVKLEMFLEIHQLVTTADIGIGDEKWVTCAEKHNDDSYAATRRAIVRVAAEIGKETE